MTNRKNILNFFLHIWEKDYRSILQGTRTALAVLCVILIYVFVKDSSLFFMGLCAFGLSQSNARSMYWRFEINLLLSFFITTAAILFSYPYSKTNLSVYIYVFVLTFMLYLFIHYKINTLFSLWTYLIPLYSILSIKSVENLTNYIYMNTIAFAICYFICVFIIPPILKKECLLETKSILRELALYIEVVELFTFEKSVKYSIILTKRREKIFIHLQSMRLMMNEIESYRKNEKKEDKINYLLFYILFSLTERFIENTIGISIKIRLLNVPLGYEPVVRRLFVLMHKTNSDMLNFLNNRKKYTIGDLGSLYEKLYIETLVEVKKIEKMGEKYIHDEIFDEIFSIAYQIKDNTSFLKSEYKFLCKKE